MKNLAFFVLLFLSLRTLNAKNSLLIVPKAPCKLAISARPTTTISVRPAGSRVVSKKVTAKSIPDEVWRTLDSMPEIQNPVITEVLPLRGSGRAFYRVSAIQNGQNKSFMLMSFGANRSDNLKYMATSDYLRSIGIRVPAIINRDHSIIPSRGEDRTLGYVLTEDLGQKTLKDVATGGTQRPKYIETLDHLTTLHTHKLSDIPRTLELEAPFDQKLYYDLEQGTLFRGKFLAGFLKLPEDQIQKALPDQERQALVDLLLKEKDLRLVHRDANAENFMFKDGQVHAIDFQGLRGGLPEYDIASLLYDPYVSFTPQMRELLLGKAHEMLKSKEVIPQNLSFEDWKKERLYPAAAQRLLQAMGAYGRLVTEEKQHSYYEPMLSARANLLEVLGKSKLLPSLYQTLKDLDLRQYRPN